MNTWEQDKGLLVIYGEEDERGVIAHFLGLPGAVMYGPDEIIITRAVDNLLERITTEERERRKTQTERSIGLLMKGHYVAGRLTVEWKEFAGFRVSFNAPIELNQWMALLVQQAQHTVDREEREYAH
jgi:hypothetical protein